MAHATWDVLGLDPFAEATRSETLVWLAEAHAAIEARLFVPRPKPTPVSLFLSDVPRSDVEGTQNALAAWGDKRAGTKGQPQLGIG